MKELKIEGQLSLDLCLDTSFPIWQSYDMVDGKQPLTLVASKILRLTIMQIHPEDTVFEPYCVTLKDLAETLGVSRSTLSRQLESVATELTSTPISVRCTRRGYEDSWLKLPLTSYCAYISGQGFYIKLNDALKPYLLNLKRYLSLDFDTYKGFTSVHALRIWEMVLCRMYDKYGAIVPDEGGFVDIPISVILTGTDTEQVYAENMAKFKSRMLDPLVRNVNSMMAYRISYERLKLQGGSFDTVRFHVFRCAAIGHGWNGVLPENR